MRLSIAKFLLVISACMLIGCSTRLSPQSTASVSQGLAATQPIPGAGVICPDNTRIRFVGTALMISHEGTFTRFTGRLDYPGSDPDLARISATVQMDSVYTQIPLLTKHLKAPDFFDTDKYPVARFVSSHIAAASATDKTHMVTGEFTIHGITKTIRFPATIDIQPANIHFTASFTIHQSDFGMNASHATGDDVAVSVDSTVGH